ncbi:MAG: mechanosensitive ion channel family protein [Chitinophagaceae bacterium]|nr:MAG: mechanosensitive ion channel family protein [Chitinophagaceae bacterium]
MRAFLNDNINKAWEFLNEPLFKLGSTEITFIFSVYLLVVIFLIFYVSKKLSELLRDKILTKYNVELGVREAISTIFRYFFVFIAFIVIVQASGIDLSALTILAGALGVGIGFGLQSITNNFVSGLIILFERPIKVGDRIEVGDTYGDVAQISARSTTILTNDNISIIVPNSKFIENEVINWSHNDRIIRFKVPVGVSYSSDVNLVKKILLEVADEHDAVLKNPPPSVQFLEFNDSSLDFILLVWTEKAIKRRSRLTSDLNFAIFKKFAEHGVEIPFPQRDLHIKSGFKDAVAKNQD